MKVHRNSKESEHFLVNYRTSSNLKGCVGLFESTGRPVIFLKDVKVSFAWKSTGSNFQGCEGFLEILINVPDVQ